MIKQKKELIDQYKNRRQTGGVFAIRNTVLDKWYIDATADLKAAENRFAAFGSSTYGKIARDHLAQKGAGFVFEVLEELTMGANQTNEEFKDDLALLKSIWMEKMADHALY